MSSCRVLLNKSVLNVIQMKFPVHDIVVLFLSLENVVVVSLSWHSLFHHCSSSLGIECLFKCFPVSDHQTENSLESIDQEEGPMVKKE